MLLDHAGSMGCPPLFTDFKPIL